MRALKADTAVTVVLGPFVDSTDGVAPETGVSVLTADFAVILKHNTGTVTDVSDTAHEITAISGANGYYTMDLTASDTDTEGMLSIMVSDQSVCLPVEETFMVMAASAYDALYTVGGGYPANFENLVIESDGSISSVTTVDNTTTVGGLSPPVNWNNLSIETDGSIASVTLVDTVTTTTNTTTVGGLAPPVNWNNLSIETDGSIASVTNVDTIASLAPPTNWNGLSIASDGSVTTDLSGVENAVWDANIVDGHQGDKAAGLLLSVLGEEMSNRIDGQSLNDLLGVADSSAGTSNLADAVWDEVLTGATHNVTNSAGKRLREVQTGGGYEGGAVYLDTNASNSGTEAFVDGTVTNPVDNLDSATTLLADPLLNLKKLVVTPGSFVDLSSKNTGFTFSGYELVCHGSMIALGSQDITDCIFRGGEITGVATGTGNIIFEQCLLGDGASGVGPDLPAGRYVHCALVGPASRIITLDASGDYYFDSCYSGVAGSGTPIVNFGASGTGTVTNVNMRNYSGGVQFNNMFTNDVVSVEGQGQVILGSTCTGGTIAIRGMFHIDDQTTGGAVEISDTSSIPESILIGRATAGAANTITLASGASTTNDTYNNCAIRIVAGTGAGQSNIITGYAGGTLIATVGNTWATNPDSTSIYQITPFGPQVFDVATDAPANWQSLVIESDGSISSVTNVDTIANQAPPTNWSNLSIETDGSIASVTLTDTVTTWAEFTTGTISELGVGAPAATPSPANAIMWLYMMHRNLQTAGSGSGATATVSNDAGTTIASAAITDDGSTFQRAEYA